MSSSTARPLRALATDVWFDNDMMHVLLKDGREISTPVEWFPVLRQASDAQRTAWRVIGDGVGIHWDELDEDLSVAGLLDS